MEALTAVTTAALTIYDMLKAIDKEMVIERIRLVEKHKSPVDDDQSLFVFITRFIIIDVIVIILTRLEVSIVLFISRFDDVISWFNDIVLFIVHIFISIQAWDRERGRLGKSRTGLIR